MSKSEQDDSGHYNSNYGNFELALYADIRKQAFGEDIGQNSWLTADEQDQYLETLALNSQTKLLDIACGAGGPALRIAEKTGCSITGIDSHKQAIAAATALAEKKGLTARAEFQVADAGTRLPYRDCEFDAVTCIDAINHLPDRPLVLAEWARVLKPGGRLLFTNATTVTGPLTKEEIAVRASIGFFLFVPAGYDAQVLADCGLRVLLSEDLTANAAETAERRRLARLAREETLRKIEGDAFEQQQDFLEVAGRLARERRLSRFVYVAEKPN